MPSTAIVPYKPRRAALTTMMALAPSAARYGRYALKAQDPRVQVAAKVIQYAYRNRRYIKYAGKRIAGLVKTRGYRRKTKFGSRMKVPTPRIGCPSIQATPPQFNTPVELGVLYLKQLIMPVQSGNANQFTTRQGTQIYLTGVRFCRQFEFLRPSEEVEQVPPIMVHWAVIQLKDADTPILERRNSIQSKFFRQLDDDDDRWAPFIDNLPSGTLWSAQKNCCAMNPDNEFNILTHQKWVMEQGHFFPTDSGPNVRPGQYIKQIDKYISIKKKIAFSTLDTNELTHPIYECVWYQTLTPSQYPTNTAVPALATWDWHTVYYRSVKPT